METEFFDQLQWIFICVDSHKDTEEVKQFIKDQEWELEGEGKIMFFHDSEDNKGHLGTTIMVGKDKKI